VNPTKDPIDFRALARKLSLVENESEGSHQILSSLLFEVPAPLIGITGPPAAGKSTLINALLQELVNEGKKIAVLAVDPSSPFNYGALLGDRVRMSAFYNSPQVYIRSIATRGSLGGISDKIIEMTDVLKCEGFDFVIVETVGVGQSEVEIAGLADITVLVLGPESGDEVQGMKAGIMEIADIYVVNKIDRPGGEAFANKLSKMVHERFTSDEDQRPIIKTEALNREGIGDLIKAINEAQSKNSDLHKRATLLAEKAFRLIQKRRMTDINKKALYDEIRMGLEGGKLNLYSLIEHK